MPGGFSFTRKTNFKLTGRVRFRAGIERQGLFASSDIVALKVEEEFDSATYRAPPRSDADLNWRRYSRWRDATALDLADPTLRWLIDGGTASIAPPVEA